MKYFCGVGAGVCVSMFVGVVALQYKELSVSYAGSNVICGVSFDETPFCLSGLYKRTGCLAYGKKIVTCKQGVL